VIVSPSEELLTLEQLRALPRDDPHRETCVYFLWRGDDLLYIGQTKDLENRIEDHQFAELIPFEWWTYIACKHFDRCELTAIHRVDLEAAYIRRYAPPHNRK